MSKTVKNIANKSLSIPNVGVVEAGETATVPDDFHNPNFEVAKSGKAADKEEAQDSAPKAEDAAKNKKADKSSK